MQLSTRHPRVRLFKFIIARVHSWQKKVSLAKKIVTFLSLILLIFTLSYFLFYKQAKPSDFMWISQYSAGQLSQIASNFNAKLGDYENISQQFLTNQDLNYLLTTYTQTKDTYDVASQNIAFANYLDGYAFTDPYFYDAMFIDEANSKRRVLTMGEALPDTFVRTFRNTGLFREIIQADGKIVWFSKVQLDDRPLYYFLLGRRIKNLFSGQPLGVLLLVIQEKNICTMINDSRFGEEPYLSETNKSDFALMTDKKGRIISAPFKMDIGKKIHHLIGRPRILPVSIPGNIISHSYMAKMKKRPVLVVVYPTEKNGWNLMNIMPVVQQSHPALLIKVLYFLGCLILFPGIILAIGLGLELGKEINFWFIQNRQKKDIPGNNHEAEPLWLNELNEKEREILILLAQGYTNKEIAKYLFVAEQTIKNYVSTIYSKLDVHDRVQASLKAIEAGLTIPRPK